VVLLLESAGYTNEKLKKMIDPNMRSSERVGELALHTFFLFAFTIGIKAVGELAIGEHQSRHRTPRKEIEDRFEGIIRKRD
jgi:hypothetical protein